MKTCLECDRTMEFLGELFFGADAVVVYICMNPKCSRYGLVTTR